MLKKTKKKKKKEKNSQIELGFKSVSSLTPEPFLTTTSYSLLVAMERAQDLESKNSYLLAV